MSVNGYSLDPLVLCGCPTYAGKEPCLEPWHEALKAQTYKHLELFVIDNTVFGTMFLKAIQDRGIPSVHLQPWIDKPFEQHTFKRCWELIYERARELGADWVFSVEADNIPAPEALDTMLQVATLARVHLITHGYPMHESAAKASEREMNTFFYDELGCMLLSTDLLEEALKHYDEYHKLSLAIYSMAERRRAGYCRLTCAFEVKHLDDAWPTEYPSHVDELDPNDCSTCPTPVPPEDYSTEIPHCLEEYVAAVEAENKPVLEEVG